MLKTRIGFSLQTETFHKWRKNGTDHRVHLVLLSLYPIFAQTPHALRILYSSTKSRILQKLFYLCANRRPSLHPNKILPEGHILHSCQRRPCQTQTQSNLLWKATYLWRNFTVPGLFFAPPYFADVAGKKLNQCPHIQHDQPLPEYADRSKPSHWTSTFEESTVPTPKKKLKQPLPKKAMTTTPAVTQRKHFSIFGLRWSSLQKHLLLTNKHTPPTIKVIYIWIQQRWLIGIIEMCNDYDVDLEADGTLKCNEEIISKQQP